MECGWVQDGGKEMEHLMTSKFGMNFDHLSQLLISLFLPLSTSLLPPLCHLRVYKPD